MSDERPAPDDVGPAFRQGATSIGRLELPTGVVYLPRRADAERALVELFHHAIARGGSGPNRGVVFGIVEESAAVLYESACGLNVAGFGILCDSYTARHIWTQHGNEKKERSRGQRAIVETDFVALPATVTEQSFVGVGEATKGLVSLQFLQLPPKGGARVVFAEVRASRRQLAVITMWRLR